MTLANKNGESCTQGVPLTKGAVRKAQKATSRAATQAVRNALPERAAAAWLSAWAAAPRGWRDQPNQRNTHLDDGRRETPLEAYDKLDWEEMEREELRRSRAVAADTTQFHDLPAYARPDPTSRFTLEESEANIKQAMSLVEVSVRCPVPSCRSPAAWMFKQTRSADEGMNVFYICTKCGKKW